MKGNKRDLSQIHQISTEQYTVLLTSMYLFYFQSHETNYLLGLISGLWNLISFWKHVPY
jgi:hypothetical protein